MLRAAAVPCASCPFPPSTRTAEAAPRYGARQRERVRTTEQRRAAAWETSAATEKGTVSCKELGYTPLIRCQRGRAHPSTEPPAPLAQASYDTRAVRAPRTPPVTPTRHPGLQASRSGGYTSDAPQRRAPQAWSSSVHAGTGRIWPRATTLSISSCFCNDVLKIRDERLRFNGVLSVCLRLRSHRADRWTGSPAQDRRTGSSAQDRQPAA